MARLALRAAQEPSSRRPARPRPTRLVPAPATLAGSRPVKATLLSTLRSLRLLPILS